MMNMSHIDREELQELLALAKEAAPEGLYQNYKGDQYRVIGHYILESTDTAGILYQPKDDPAITWGKPLLSFFERVEVDGHRVRRFTQISE
jgi:hypothetical protein